MPLGSTYSVNTDLTLYFDLDADLQAFTDGVALGTVAGAADTGNAYIWNGTSWKSLNANAFYSGNGTPSSSLGVNGDIYIDFDTGNVYEKVSGSWVVQGDISPTIPPDSWIYGTTTATTSQGSNSNFYSEYTNNRVYQKGSTTSTITSTSRIAEGTSASAGVTNFQTTSAVTAVSGRLYMAYVWASKGNTVTPSVPNILSVTGGPNWSLVKTTTGATSSVGTRMSVFSAMSTSTLAGATLGIATGTAGIIRCHVAEFTGTDTSGTDGSGAIVQSQSTSTTLGASLGATMNAFGDSTNNAVIAGYAHNAAEGTTQDSGFTELADGSHASGASGWGYETSWLLGQDTSPTATWATSAVGVTIAVEIKAAVNSSTWNRLVPGLPTYKSTFDVVSTSATTNLISQSIPAGLLETTSGIQIIIEGDYLNNTGSTQTATMVASLSSTNLWGDTTPTISSSSTRRPFYFHAFLRNESSASTQRLSGIISSINSPGSPVTGATAGLGTWGTSNIQVGVIGGSAAVDTTNAATLAITFAHSANAATLEFRGTATLIVIP